MLRVGTELVAGLHGEGERGGGEAALLQEPPSVVEPLLAKPVQLFRKCAGLCVGMMDDAQQHFGHFWEMNIQKACLLSVSKW